MCLVCFQKGGGGALPRLWLLMQLVWLWLLWLPGIRSMRRASAATTAARIVGNVITATAAFAGVIARPGMWLHNAAVARGAGSSGGGGGKESVGHFLFLRLGSFVATD